MTPAEKMAQDLEREPIDHFRDSAEVIRRLAAALKDYDEGWDRRDILAMRHADALRDVKEMP